MASPDAFPTQQCRIPIGKEMKFSVPVAAGDILSEVRSTLHCAMSLQDSAVLQQFVTNCTELWKTWNNGPQAGREAARQTAIRQAVTQMASFMVPPTVAFRTMDGWGSFSWGSWRLSLNRKYTAKDDIRYGKFLEFCSTMYHETRHGEQFYRIAQGLALGRLKYPDASKAQVIQSLTGPATGVSGRVALFGGGRGVTGAELLPDAALLSQWMGISMATALRAQANRQDFDTFIAKPAPAWFRRSALLEVDDWMRATYKKTYAEMDSFAQAEDDAPGAGRRNVYKMYRSLPEENDAHSIEEMVVTALTARIGHADATDARRTEPPFVASLIRLVDWKTKTSRMLHTRSQDLVHLDQALEAHELLPSAANRANLRTQFDIWYRNNPREASTRNVDGCVEGLRTWLVENP